MYLGEAAVENKYKNIKSSANNILEVLVNQYDVEKIRKTFDINPAPTTLILIQELKIFNCLLAQMRTSLILIRKVYYFFKI